MLRLPAPVVIAASIGILVAAVIGLLIGAAIVIFAAEFFTIAVVFVVITAARLGVEPLALAHVFAGHVSTIAIAVFTGHMYASTVVVVAVSVAVVAVVIAIVVAVIVAVVAIVLGGSESHCAGQHRECQCCFGDH